MLDQFSDKKIKIFKTYDPQSEKLSQISMFKSLVYLDTCILSESNLTRMAARSNDKFKLLLVFRGNGCTR